MNRGTVIHAMAALDRQAEDLAEVRELGGGSFGPTALLTLRDGTNVFAKFFPYAERDRADAERDGLSALAQAHAPAVPEVYGVVGESPASNYADGVDADGGDAHDITGRRPVLLLMSYHPPDRATDAKAARLGRELAALHRTLRANQPGFPRNNYIGATPQANAPVEPGPHEWQRFFAQRRLLPLAQALTRRSRGHSGLLERIQILCDRLPGLLPSPDDGRPSLLHGDLWSGNVLYTAEGAMLIDPAVYHGHREADLAMTELFGGFPADFMEAYRDAWPLEPGYPERVPLYNLYHLLNHALLFGDSWLGGVQGTLRRFVG